MKIILKILILFLLASCASAQTWPSAAIPNPLSGAPVPGYGRFSILASGTMLSDDIWKEQRSKLAIGIGLGRGLGFHLEGSMRKLNGMNAFQQGLEDARLGMSYWPLSIMKGSLRAGLNANFVLPVGYRTQESYYDSVTDTVLALPSFSLKQNAGEAFAGIVWSPHTAASLSAFAGLFETSDRSDQVFRWGFGTHLAPFGSFLSTDIGYCKSTTRTGLLPDAEVLTANLGLSFLGFTLMPGIWADMQDQPYYGTSLGLRIDGNLPKSIFTQKAAKSVAPPPPTPHRSGAILIPPPQSDIQLAGRDELWQELTESAGEVFDFAVHLESLDVPGLPFDKKDRSRFWNSMRAIHEDYPEIRWLLYSQVESEEVSRTLGLHIPFLISKPEWTADCRIHVQLVDLQVMLAYTEQVIDARSIRSEGVHFPLFSTMENDVLTFSETRELKLSTYSIAGRELVRQLPEGE